MRLSDIARAVSAASAVGERPSAPGLMSNDVIGHHQPRSARDVLAGLLHQRSVDHGRETRLPTGFDPLDEILEGGMKPEDLVIVGGKPGAGKTIAMLQWSRNMAAAGHRVLFASYEHSERNMLGRLLMAEVGARSPHLDSEQRRNVVRLLREAVMRGVIGEDPDTRRVVREAYDAIDSFADNLLLQRVSGYHTGPFELRELVERHVGDGGVIFVDYLQKVPVAGARDDQDRVLQVAESLKELAMTHDVCVVAAAAVEPGQLEQRRLKLAHLRGSALLAHEADLAMALNDKATAVSKTHLAYDPHLFERAQNQSVLTIEKNREGPANVHLEFDRDFAHYRFHPVGRYVAERLTDDLFEE